MAIHEPVGVADHSYLDCESWLHASVHSHNGLSDDFLDLALASSFPEQAANSVNFDDYLSPPPLTLDMTLEGIDTAKAVPDLGSPVTNADDAASPASTLRSPLSPGAASCSSFSDAEGVAPPRKHGKSTRPGARGPRLSHNAVEKNYRDNVNAALQRLQRAVPRVAAPASTDTDANGLEFAVRPPTKAAILHAAVDYIQQLVQERANAQHEADALRAVVRQRELLLNNASLEDAVEDVLTKRRRVGRPRMP